MEQQVMLDRMVLAVKNAHKAIQLLKDENEKLKNDNEELKKKILFYEKKERSTHLVPQQQQYRVREEERDDEISVDVDKPVESLVKEVSAIPKHLKSVSSSTTSSSSHFNPQPQQQRAKQQLQQQSMVSALKDVPSSSSSLSKTTR